MKEKKHIIQSVTPGSIAEELELEAGDAVLAVNDSEIEDIFDYQFLTQDSYIELLVEKKDKEEWLLEIDKDPDEDLGIQFENGLMDEYRSCRNKCVFCFIDQMPDQYERSRHRADYKIPSGPDQRFSADYESRIALRDAA